MYNNINVSTEHGKIQQEKQSIRPEEKIKKYLPTNAKFNDVCNFFSVFTDVTRVKILTALILHELSVTELSEILDLNQTTVSHQLKLLRDASMVGFRRDGKILYYSATNKHIDMVMQSGIIGAGMFDDSKAIEKEATVS
ncbi:MAG: metalloregulator ArsR/SmtB family transcription factor [Bacillota bacterium]